MDLKILDCPIEKALECWNQESAGDRGKRRRENKPTHVREQVMNIRVEQVFFDSFREERSLKRVRGVGNQGQDIEECQRNRNPTRSYAGDPDGIRQRADQVNDERQQANNGEVSIHGADSTLLRNPRKGKAQSLDRQSRVNAVGSRI